MLNSQAIGLSDNQTIRYQINTHPIHGAMYRIRMGIFTKVHGGNTQIIQV